MSETAYLIPRNGKFPNVLELPEFPVPPQKADVIVSGEKSYLVVNRKFLLDFDGMTAQPGVQVVAKELPAAKKRKYVRLKPKREDEAMGN